jgi:hypothetical protein
MAPDSSWLERLDREAVIIEWIEPWMEQAEDPQAWGEMLPAVRAIVCGWLLSVYSLRGGAASFL